MQGAKEIKGRKKSISNIGQIAKAMEVVSITKMRKSQKIALETRPYTKEALNILKTISQKISPSHSYFLEKRSEEKIAILIISSDKGLCGGLNSNIFRQSEKLLKQHPDAQINFIAIGKKGADWCQRNKLEVIKSFSNLGDYVDFKQIIPVSEFIIEIFKEKKYDAVWAIYTNFLNALKQEAVTKMILPLEEKSLQEIINDITPTYGKFADSGNEPPSPQIDSLWNFEYKFEPSMKDILDDLLYNLTQVEIYYTILENNASEHSARRLAMKNASDNASNIIQELNLSYNKARQAAITQEISEIAAGANI